MLVPLILDSFGGDIYEGAGPKSGGGGGKTAIGNKGAVGKGDAEAKSAAGYDSKGKCVAGQCKADELANTYKSKIITARSEMEKLIINMNTLKTELTNTKGDKYKKLNGILGSPIITKVNDALTKEITAAGLVKSALDAKTAGKANTDSIATTKLVTDVNKSIKTISDKKTGTDKTELTQLTEQMKSFNDKLIPNAKSVKDAITVLLSSPTGKTALAAIK